SLAMLLLDAEAGARTPTAASADLTRSDADEDSSAYAVRIRQRQQISAAGQLPLNTGAAPDDLLDVLAQIALASPAVCTLRALRRVLPDADPYGQLAGAAQIASGFRALFNGPEATAIVAASTDGASF